MSSPKTASRPKHNWGQRRRLAFIEFRLQWERRVNRAHIQQFFGISAPQATNDLREYAELQGEGMTYDPRERAYRPTSSFKVKLSDGHADEYLHELIAHWAGYTNSSSSFIGALPSENGLVALPPRIVPSKILVEILRAIREREAVEVDYLSLKSGRGYRWIEPHALAWDGARWHLRAYSQKSDGFRDFVLTRISKIANSAPAESSPESDELWHKIITVRLKANPALDAFRREALELDFGMKDGCCEVQIRAALVPYLLSRLGLPEMGWQAPARAQQLVLDNRDEIAPILDEILPNWKELYNWSEE